MLPDKLQPTSTGAALGQGADQLEDPRAISTDGSRVVWSTQSPHALYLRENAGQAQSRLGSHGECLEPSAGCTVQIDAPQGGSDAGGEGHFLAASAGDSQIFFADTQKLTPGSTASAVSEQRGDLYRFEPEAAADAQAGRPHG